MKPCEYILVALIGFGGVVTGAVLNAIKDFVAFRYQNSQQTKLDNTRKGLLKTMLDDPKYSWRELETLKNVIGADEATAIRLLLDIGARGSENLEPTWGLISRNPLPSRQ